MSLLQIYEPDATPEPHARGIVVGIDLGTTNSVVACVKGDEPVALENEQGETIIPSALFYDEDGRVSVGKDAFSAAKAQGMFPWQSIKRLMGKSALEAKSHLPVLSNNLVSSNDAIPTFRLCGVEKNPITMSADILSHLREIASSALQQNVTKAVITVPAYFDDAARLATTQAAEIAGIEVLRLINEPTAAALAYGLENNVSGLYAVYDLGGGTFDISVLRLEEGVFQVLATGGDTSLGGDDIDAAIALYLRKKYQLDIAEAELLQIARSMKEQIAANESVTIADMVISLSELQEITKPILQRTALICEATLKDAALQANGLDGVVLVGGSTKLQLVRDAVSQFFDCNIYDNLDPDRVVAYGAAIQAHALQMGAEHLLLDVVPLSLGLETMGGIVEKIIYRNSPIPAYATQSFTTYADGQTAMQIHILQGERELVEQNRSLARFELSGIPPLPAGIARIEVSFTVDANGMLTVSAQELHTGIKQVVNVKPSYGLSIEEIERMIIESMEHGRADIMARLLIEAKVEARRSIEELDSAMQRDSHLLSQQEITIIEQLKSELQKALDSNERDAINAAHETLKSALLPFAERRMNAAIQNALQGRKVADM
jgi:molecular chaperone HscA